MAKRKASNSGEAQFSKTAYNLAKKGKTNKKLKLNPMASKYETLANKELTEKAKEYAAAHPKGTGYKYRKLKAQAK